MKYVFLVAFILLLLASLVTWSISPSASETPVIYWVTDSNPARIDQVKLFHDWLIKNGHFVTKKFDSRDELLAFLARQKSFAHAIEHQNQNGKSLVDGTISDSNFPIEIKIPVVELRLDMANNDQSKKVIQGVSGVASDVIDMFSGGEMRYYQAMGLLKDITEVAKPGGYSLDKTYEAVVPELAIASDDGRLTQYMFPCNVSVPMYVVNNATFKQHGIKPPSGAWTIDEFEATGRAFVTKANEGRPRRTVFFAEWFSHDILRGAFGGSRFNETLTACTMDDLASRRTLEKYYQWTYVDRLFPSEADRSSFTTDSGYGGQSAQLLVSDDPDRGQVGLLLSGRWMFILFRQITESRVQMGKTPLDLGAAEPPSSEFRCSKMATRAAGVYSGSKHPEFAELFLSFLASEEYNMQIVRDADALPPDPKYTKIDAYISPVDFPEEAGVHAPFAEAAIEIAVGNSYSPFALDSEVSRIEREEASKFMNGLQNLEETLKIQTRLVNDLIARRLNEDPTLKPRYELLVARQKQIDEFKSRLVETKKGEPIPDEMKIPRELISNPHHLAYYKTIGWIK